MSAGESPAADIGGTQFQASGRPAAVAASRLGLLVRRVFAAFCAVLGGSLLVGTAIFVLDLDDFARIAADRILANAVRPAGREMPATAGSIPYRSGDVQVVGGMGQGLSCSLPSFLDRLAFPTDPGKSPIGLRMRQACAYHDYCYRHGAATYGFTQADCDFALQAQAFRLCTFIETAGQPDANGHVKDGNCMRDARLVTLGVRIGGSDSFRTLEARAVPSVNETRRSGSDENTSTFFEFDPYPTRSAGYTVYRIADAPPCSSMAWAAKAIYRFTIRPSGIVVSYSVGFGRFWHYLDIPGDPHYVTSAPLVVHAGAGSDAADWFVWWQRAGEDSTVGRLVAIAPKQASGGDTFCRGLTESVDAAPRIIKAEIGRDEKRREDPQIDQLQPADLRPAAGHVLSLVTLRNHHCLDPGNAPCFVHVMVRTDTGLPLVQEQEPLSINDRFSRKPANTDIDRYRNFASLPFVLDPPGAEAPVIAWTRRDTNYQTEARLRRAAVDAGTGTGTRDDTARSQGTVLLSGFAESDEPAFVLGRSGTHPILASLSDTTAALGASSAAMREWPLPPPDIDDLAREVPAVAVDPDRCRPGLEAEWLVRPPQVLGQADGSALVVFSRLRPFVSANWTAAELQLATLAILPDGSCPMPAWRGTEIAIPTPPERGKTTDPLESGRAAFVRISRSPLLLADLNGDGSVDVALAESGEPDIPLPICSIAADGSCSVNLYP
ncbi:hypothetical protein [Mesorhizobium sp. CA7]|uniref:hypothetical protein n=1 Tax=Mesorhizobium sp. CA7 TaxID=588501 RepID=UPI001CC917F3|nr:hypothetical protein [Mesorhizobium sp. CA7]MBZ9814750.1 hypothetical protein [Mesorhizobium sp. CA7]